MRPSLGVKSFCDTGVPPALLDSTTWRAAQAFQDGVKNSARFQRLDRGLTHAPRSMTPINTNKIKALDRQWRVSFILMSPIPPLPLHATSRIVMSEEHEDAD